MPRWPSSMCWPLAVALGWLRLLYLPSVNLYPVEAYYRNHAQHLDIDQMVQDCWLVCDDYTQVAEGLS